MGSPSRCDTRLFTLTYQFQRLRRIHHYGGFDGFEGAVSIGGRLITNLRFADDIDLVAGKAEELVNLTRRLEESANKFGMQISAGKSDNDEDIA